MYLAYLDDSGSDAKSPVVLVGAVIIEDSLFAHLETVLGLLVEGLLPDDRQKSFKEFHATELFWGNGAFAGIPEEQRHGAIRSLLGIVKQFRLPFIYSAVDRALLAASPMGSAHPVDTAFRMCSLGIQDWLRKPQRRAPEDSHLLPGHSGEPLCLFIADDTKDGALKQIIRTSSSDCAHYHQRNMGGQCHGDCHWFTMTCTSARLPIQLGFRSQMSVVFYDAAHQRWPRSVL